MLHGFPAVFFDVLTVCGRSPKLAMYFSAQVAEHASKATPFSRRMSQPPSMLTHSDKSLVWYEHALFFLVHETH